MTKQVFDQRVTKAEVAQAALHAAEAQDKIPRSGDRVEGKIIRSPCARRNGPVSKTDPGGRYERT
jgi:hypothetical protein